VISQSFVFGPLNVESGQETKAPIGSWAKDFNHSLDVVGVGAVTSEVCLR